MELIDRSAVVVELEKRIAEGEKVAKELPSSAIMGLIQAYKNTLSFLDTLEVKDPYEQCIQYDSVKAGIQAHAETYSFNIESQLFPQLTKEQQALWRKEIEQACISGGDAGVTLARDQRYKENLEVKDVKEPSKDLEEEIYKELDENWYGEYIDLDKFRESAKHFFELGLKAQKGK